MQSVTSNAVYNYANKIIKYKSVNLSNITINSNGYFNINNYRPSGMTNFLFALMWNYGNVSSKNALGVNANGQYIYGTANAVITSIEIRFFYTD